MDSEDHNQILSKQADFPLKGQNPNQSLYQHHEKSESKKQEGEDLDFIKERGVNKSSHEGSTPKRDLKISVDDRTNVFGGSQLSPINKDMTMKHPVKPVTIMRKLSHTRLGSMERGRVKREAIENFLKTHSGFTDNINNAGKIRYDRAGSPLKRSVIGSVEIYQKEKTKRTSMNMPEVSIESVSKRKTARSRLGEFNKKRPIEGVKKAEKVSKYIKSNFSDHQMHEFIENYYIKRKSNLDEQSSMFSTTMKSFDRGSCLSLDRGNKDNRFFENYENNRNRWKKYANFLSKKVGRQSPENSLINSSDFYCENLQKKSDFDEVQEASLQKSLHGWYGTLRLSPLDGKLNRNYIPVGKHGDIGASEVLHNKSKLLMKKPKDFFLFGNKPLSTSIMDRIEMQKKTSQELPFLDSRKKHLLKTLAKGENQITNMNELFIKGINKFESEVEYGLSIPENKRVLYLNSEEMKSEKLRLSTSPEEIIESHFESKILY
ncbi:unnamed protein product [Moneuplotes crassus]|uniref:Uncharacterized protein n=1 Tax=Euplotes crassus TaxID=5936 RepID=A0AAD1UCG5_EUPCR|nr:unnamed protein product [Moneuplotes crassus]